MLLAQLGADSLIHEMNEARNAVRPLLEQAAYLIRTARQRLAAQVTELLSKLEFVAIPRFENGSLSYKYIVYSIAASAPDLRQYTLADKVLPIAGWALALVLDKNRDFGRQLSTCCLSGCNRLFLATTGKDGGRPTRYCSEEHIAEAKRQQAVQRSQRYRDNKARLHK